MAYELMTALVLLSVFVLTVILRWIYRRREIHRLFKKHGIPGPEPSFFTGNMHQLRVGNTPNDVLSQWLEQYGNVFGFFIGETPHLVVNDLNFLKQALIKDFSYFSDRSETLLDTEPLSISLLGLKGQKWKEVRGVLTPSFSSAKIKLMTAIMNRKIDIMVDMVKRKVITNESFDMYEVVQSLTLDIIAECALAMKVNCLENPEDPFLIAVRNFFLYMQNKLVEYAMILPIIAKILRFMANYLTAAKMTTMIVENLKEVIAQRKQNYSDVRGIDMLQLMLDAAKNKNDSMNEFSDSRKNALMTDDDVIANAYVFLLAGHETTSTALGFTFHLLVKYPEVQEKLYEEITSNIADDQWSYDSVHSLQYLDQVLNESLRIYPPVTGFVTRKCLKEYKFGDVIVPAGTVLQAPVWDIHHDPKLWPDPWKFDPDRFSPENKKNINSMSFLPFGAGPRNCIGMRFAQLEAKLAISKLVQKFKFVPCEKTEIDLKLRKQPVAIVINPENGIHLRAVPRDTSVS